MTENVEIPRCPDCGAAEYTPTGPAAPAFSTEAGGEQFTQADYFVRKCANCSLLYRTPTLSDGALADYYSRVPFEKWQAAAYHPIERAVLSILRSLPSGSKILDYGCSSGRLLSGLTTAYRCFGAELNERAAAEAGRQGLTMLPLHEVVGGTSHKFDAVVLVDVFEHLRQPRAVLRNLAQHLVPGGLLIVATGNGDALACRRDPAQFWYFRNVEHLCMATEKHMHEVARALDLSLDPLLKVSHYDLSWRERAVLWFHDFAHWQFRRKTLLAKALLRFLPRVRQAQHWRSAPSYTSSKDHLVAVFRR